MSHEIATVDYADTLAVLRAARDFLSDPGHWTRGHYWTGRTGVPVTRCREKVAKCCAVGALSFVANCDRDNHFPNVPQDLLDREAHRMGYESIVSLNDNECVGHATILAVYDRAIERASRP